MAGSRCRELLVKMFNQLLLTRAECERDRLVFQPSFLHLIPHEVVCNLLIEVMAGQGDVSEVYPAVKASVLFQQWEAYDRFAGRRNATSANVDHDAGLSFGRRRTCF